jgi:hypothetical protein
MFTGGISGHWPATCGALKFDISLYRCTEFHSCSQPSLPVPSSQPSPQIAECVCHRSVLHRARATVNQQVSVRTQTKNKDCGVKKLPDRQYEDNIDIHNITKRSKVQPNLTVVTCSYFPSRNMWMCFVVACLMTPSVTQTVGMISEIQSWKWCGKKRYQPQLTQYSRTEWRRCRLTLLTELCWQCLQTTAIWIVLTVLTNNGYLNCSQSSCCTKTSAKCFWKARTHKLKATILSYVRPFTGLGGGGARRGTVGWGTGLQAGTGFDSQWYH